MFNKLYVVIGSSEADIYRLMRIATNHHLHATYKIGVYGGERQHELFVTGAPWNYYKFKNAIATPIAKIESKKSGAQ